MVKKLKEAPTLRCRACGAEVVLSGYMTPTGSREQIGYWNAPCPCGKFQLFVRDDEEELTRIKRVEREREKEKGKEKEREQEIARERKERNARKEAERENLILNKLSELGEDAYDKIPGHWGLGRIDYEVEKTLMRLVREKKISRWRKTCKHVWRYGLTPHQGQ